MQKHQRLAGASFHVVQPDTVHIKELAGRRIVVLCLLNFVGIMLGGLVIGIAEAFGTIYLEGSLGHLMPYIIFVMIMLFRPQGLTWSSSR